MQWSVIVLHDSLLLSWRDVYGTPAEDWLLNVMQEYDGASKISWRLSKALTCQRIDFILSTIRNERSEVSWLLVVVGRTFEDRQRSSF